jgi:hypothetical protein
MMKRSCFEHDGLTLSYLDSGGDGPLIVALHAMWMEARTFEGFAQAMREWRVVSLDQARRVDLRVGALRSSRPHSIASVSNEARGQSIGQTR